MAGWGSMHINTEHHAVWVWRCRQLLLFLPVVSKDVDEVRDRHQPHEPPFPRVPQRRRLHVWSDGTKWFSTSHHITRDSKHVRPHHMRGKHNTGGAPTQTLRLMFRPQRRRIIVERWRRKASRRRVTSVTT